MTIAFWPCFFAIGCPLWIIAGIFTWYMSSESLGWGNAFGYPGMRLWEAFSMWAIFATVLSSIAYSLTWLAVLFSNFHLEIHHG